MTRRILPPLFFSVWLPTRLAMLWRGHIHRQPAAIPARKGATSIIVFRLDALGDVVMTTPLLRALKRAHPRSQITVVVQRPYKPLLATNPNVSEVLCPPELAQKWMPRQLRRWLAAVLFYRSRLRGRHFDYALMPRWDTDEHLATMLCALTNAATRVGYTERTTAAKQASNRGFDRVYDICLPPGPVQHEVLRNLAVAAAIGVTSSDSRLELHVTGQDRLRAARLLTEIPAATKLIAFGIGAASPGRRWPLRRFARVVEELERKHNVQAVIVGSAAELADAQRLAACLRRPPVILSGAPLREVCAVLACCELFIGNDSGCAHLAAAMGRKTIVISRHPRDGHPNHFNSPLRFAPHGRDVQVLQPASGLDECAGACRSLLPHCIRAVSAEDVAAVAEQMLSRASEPVLAWTEPAQAADIGASAPKSLALIPSAALPNARPRLRDVRRHS